MEMWEKTKEATKSAVDLASQAINHVTGTTALRETEKFHQEMEAVYAALVTRIISAEARIDRLDRERKRAFSISVVAVLLAAIALVVSLAR